MNRRKTRNITSADPYAGLLRGGPGTTPMAAQDGFVDHEALRPLVIDPRRNPGALIVGCINARMKGLESGAGLHTYAAVRGDVLGVVSDQPIIVLGGTGQGKGTAFSIPNCYAWPHGLGVQDPKLEIVRYVGAYREKHYGQSVHVLNPSGITGEAISRYESSFNPLIGVDSRDAEAVLRRSALVAEACVAPPENTDTHWEDNAREVLRAIVAHVLADERYAKRRTLAEVYRLVMLLEGTAVKDELRRSVACEGYVQQAMHGLFTKADREFSSVVSSLRTAMDFLKSPLMRRTLSGDGFDMADLPRGKISCFYGVSPGQQEICKGFSRLVTACMFNAFEESDFREDLSTQVGGPRSLLLIEEAGILGRGFTRLAEAAAILRGYGALLATVWQDVAQVQFQMGDRWTTMFANAGTQLFLGSLDEPTCAMASQLLGSTLIHAPSLSTPTFEGRVQRGESGVSYNLSTHPLMTPSEVRRTFSRYDKHGRALCLLGGLAPAIVHKVHYHTHEAFTEMVRHAG